MAKSFTIVPVTLSYLSITAVTGVMKTDCSVGYVGKSLVLLLMSQGSY